MLIKIMSLNLRYDKPDVGVQNWHIRKEAIASLIKQYQPHLIGTQEGLPHQIQDLKNMLPDYTNIGGDRSGSGTSEHCSILFRYHELYCLETQDFFLSDTPNIAGSISWDHGIPRMTTWGRFKILTENLDHEIILFNTHLDHEVAKARELGVKLIKQIMGNFDLNQGYFFLTGDFNTEFNSNTRKLLTQVLNNQVKLEDSLSKIHFSQNKTFHDFTGKGLYSIDTIYYDSRLKMSKIMIEQSKFNQIFPSDHFPIYGEFDF